MDILQKVFDDALSATLLELEESVDDEEIHSLLEDTLHSTIPQIVEEILNTLKDSASEMLKERRSSSAGFVGRNICRWEDGFNLLEMLLVIAIESAEDYNASYRPKAAKSGNIVFDVLIRLQARACHISSEILCLLKNGYSDGAHARWRALHEVVATAYFIDKHGKDAAEHYLAHEVVVSYKGMLQHNKYADRLNEEPFTNTELRDSKLQYDRAIDKYGANFKNASGWASKFLGTANPNFAQIESDVALDHMRPYYRWASQNVHASVKGIRNPLGLCEATEDILLVGQSDSGMTDPAHCTAISLTQITSLLLNSKPNLDSIVISKVLLTISREIGEAFLHADKPKG